MRLPRSSSLLVVAGGLALAAAAFDVGIARADALPCPPAAADELATLLGRLERHAAQIEQMKKLASYTVRGRMDELDGNGRVSHAKEMVARVTATGGDPRFDISRFLDDGVDKTDEAQTKARERREKKRADEPKRDFHLPFLASERGRYSFSIAERDASNGARVRIAFEPRAAAEDLIRGSAWVDGAAGEVLTMGFSLSKNPSFIDHVDITVTFDQPTSLGRAPSLVTFEARGGFLFVKKRYRGTARVEDPQVGTF